MRLDDLPMPHRPALRFRAPVGRCCLVAPTFTTDSLIVNREAIEQKALTEARTLSQRYQDLVKGSQKAYLNHVYGTLVPGLWGQDSEQAKSLVDDLAKQVQGLSTQATSHCNDILSSFGVGSEHDEVLAILKCFHDLESDLWQCWEWIVECDSVIQYLERWRQGLASYQGRWP